MKTLEIIKYITNLITLFHFKKQKFIDFKKIKLFTNFTIKDSNSNFLEMKYNY
jgi:hypothetical protein